MNINKPNFSETYEPTANAQKYGMKVNPKVYTTLAVMDKLKENQITYGAPYCPCLPTHNEDTICPCRYMREMKACRCGLYVRP